MNESDKLQKKNRFDKYLQTLHRKGEFNGNVLIAEAGEILYEKSVGTADFLTGRKLNKDTVFDLASVSKAFTAMAVMILKEHGKLSYQDGAEKFFEGFPYPGITVRHLLTHTSGVPDYFGLFLEKWDRCRMATNYDILDMLRTHRPKAVFKPGERFEYSNTGYTLLAMIVETVSGQPFMEFLKENIFEPLEMSDTRVINRGLGHSVPDNFAIGYVHPAKSMDCVLPETLKETDFVKFMDGMQGDGAVNSTIEDVYKWDRALYTSGLVSEKTLVEAFQPVVLNDGSTFGYGFGWGILDGGSRGKILRHAGGWPGYKTIFIRFIEQDKTIIALCNVEQSDEIWMSTIETLQNLLFEDVCSMEEVRM